MKRRSLACQACLVLAGLVVATLLLVGPLQPVKLGLCVCVLLVIAWLAWEQAWSSQVEDGVMLTTSVELWFVRHAQSVNNELNAGVFGKLAYVLCNACLSSRDPHITEGAERECAAAGQWLKKEKTHFDLVLSSMMLRTMQTAMHTFCDTGLISEVTVAPFISEVPVWLGCYPRISNMPLARSRQLERLRALRGSHGNGGLPLDFSLVGGEAGDNSDGMPPSMPGFLRWLWAQPRVQALVSARRLSGGLVRIAVVSHGTFLRKGLKLRKHPRNNAVTVARLQVGIPDDVLGVGAPTCEWRPRKHRVALTPAEVIYPGSTL